MESVKERRFFVKFSFKLMRTAAEIHNMLHEVYNIDHLEAKGDLQMIQTFKK
jgi:hypothetical protein